MMTAVKAMRRGTPRTLVQRGFSLIEVMVVVAIVGILAGVVYPSYKESVLKGARTSAKAKMLDVSSRLQRHHSQHGKYTLSFTDLELPLAVQSDSKGHNITLTYATPGDTSTFKITATPVKSDIKCPTLTLDHLGVHGPTGC